jgi:hypothetical protein
MLRHQAFDVNASYIPRHWRRFRRRSRVRPCGVVAWSVTIVVALAMVILSGIAVAEMIKGALSGALPLNAKDE